MKGIRIAAMVLAALLISGLPGCTEPTATEPVTTGSQTGETPNPTQTESAYQGITEPDPTQSVPTIPTEPEPTEPQPTEPPPTEAKPTEPEPTQPKEEQIGSRYTRAELEAMSTETNDWGPGVRMDEQNRPYGALEEQEKYGQYDAFFITPAVGQIYLTFDEGYENGFTPRILDVLKEKNIKAVFFVTMPYCKSNPELVRRMIDEGHAVGNHSVHHKSMPGLSIDEMVSEVMELHEYVKEQFSYEMHLFRPPMGEFSQQSLAVLQSLGYKTVQWSFAYYDYEPEDQMEPEKAYKKVTGAAHEGAVYLLHAISETNAEILGDVIDFLQDQGYRLELFD